jgi:hypothetical protein
MSHAKRAAKGKRHRPMQKEQKKGGDNIGPLKVSICFRCHAFSALSFRRITYFGKLLLSIDIAQR